MYMAGMMARVGARVWQNVGSGARSPDSERAVVNGPGPRGMPVGGIHDHTGAMQGLTTDASVTDVTVAILPSPQRPLLCIVVVQKHALPAHVVARPPSGV